MSKMKDEAIKQSENMKIWDAVSKTDPEHTKTVDFGRKFTAIDAHYQIMEATQQFGPVGSGWKYSNQYGELHLQDGRILAHCDVTLFWMSEGKKWEGNTGQTIWNNYGPIRGCAVLLGFDKSGKLKAPDTDAYKKASTDALTKGLSHLGFNADVFLGMFDDNKYVQELKTEKKTEKTASELAYQQDKERFTKAIQACTKPSEMDAVLKNHELWMAGLPIATSTQMRSWVLKKKTELADGSK